MLFVLVITVVFVLISIYFFFRAEKLHKQLINQQRESSLTRKENKLLVDSITLIAARGEGFAKSRLEQLKANAKANENLELLKHVSLITPLINNYSTIFRECLKGKGRLKSISQKCFESQDKAAYKKFVALIVTSDKKLKRYWSSDNLNGFLYLVDGLFTILEDMGSNTAENNALAKSNTLVT